jgi:hypothetical protein
MIEGRRAVLASHRQEHLGEFRPALLVGDAEGLLTDWRFRYQSKRNGKAVEASARLRLP